MKRLQQIDFNWPDFEHLNRMDFDKPAQPLAVQEIFMVFDRSGFSRLKLQSRTTQFIKNKFSSPCHVFVTLKRGDKLTALPLGGLKTPATIVPRVFRPKGFPLLYLNHVLQ